jgi:hypothetical protein
VLPARSAVIDQAGAGYGFEIAAVKAPPIQLFQQKLE